MKSTAIVYAIVHAIAVLLSSAHVAAASEPLLIENVTVISPEQAQPMGNRHVLIVDGRIAAVGERMIAAPAGTRRLDGTGKYLTPGIMDAHVHVSQAVGLPFESDDPAIAALSEAFFAQQPRSYLYFGVTQVLDPSNMPEQVAVFAAQEQHPDIFRCGAAGLLLLAHANALDMQRIAVAEDVDVIVHGVWNWNDADGQEGIPAVVAQHLRNIRAKDIGYQATLRVLPGVTDLLRPDVLDDPMYAKVVPPALLAWYRTEPAQWFKREVFGADVDAAAVLARRRAANEHWATSERGMRALRYLYELGQPMLLGSDTPSAPTYGNQPGYDTYREMQLMAQAGIPLSAIFAAATINNAQRFRLEKDYGTIERGKVANLLLLDGNPLASVAAWNSIDTVILHGEPIERETLAADRIGAAPAP